MKSKTIGMESDTSDGNAKETDKPKSNSELIKQEEIEGTPFNAMCVEGKWFLALGKYRLTEQLKSLEECKKDALRSDWARVMQVMWATAQTVVDERGGDYISNQLKLKLAKEKLQNENK